jgi:acyl-CoA dehydrogenase
VTTQGVVAHSTLQERVDTVLPVLREAARSVDVDAVFPVESVRALRESGLMGLFVPSEFGGMGCQLDSFGRVASELGGECLSTAMIWAMHCQQTDVIVRYGSAKLQHRVLPKIARGELYLASVTSERGNGGDLLRASATLVDHAEGIAFERDAPIVTGGAHADAFLITMRDSSTASPNEVSLIYADRDDMRVRGEGVWDPMGMRATHSVPMTLSGVIPMDNVLGSRGRFRDIAVESFIPSAHIGWSACWLGAARGALRDVIKLLRSRRRPPSLNRTSELLWQRLARVRTRIEVVSSYLDSVTREVEARRRDGLDLDQPSLQIHLNSLKVLASEETHAAVEELIHLVGLGLGYMRTSPIALERIARDLRSATLNFHNDRLMRSNGVLSLVDPNVGLIGFRE